MRFLSLYSCGAASAVATKLALEENKNEYKEDFVILYTEVVQEHTDNKRFLLECQEWFGHDITVIRNEIYNGSIYEVFIANRFIVSPGGAPCTKVLKKQTRERFQKPDDVLILGFTYEEQNRLDRFLDANNVEVWTPLIDAKITKADCLAILKEQLIEIPTMYKLGYKNNNCIGCVKGGLGYWNKIRDDFPEQFNKMAALEKQIGGKILKKQIKGKRDYIWLTDLNPGDGRYSAEPDIECGVVCMQAIEEIDVTCEV